jgi:hypothetical protein
LRSGGFLAQKFNRRTELELSSKLSFEALHPPLRKTAVSTSPFSSVVFVRVISCLFLVRWLGGSFAKLGFSVGLCGFANVPPNAWAILSFRL